MEMNENLRWAIFGQNTMRFKWSFDEDEEQCRRMKLGLLQQIVIVIMPTIWQSEN